jgi:uncharacterized protein (DUF1778 family)
MARKTKRNVTINVRTTDELRAAVRALADADGRTLSAFVERLLQAHIADAKEKASGDAEASAKPKRRG